MIFISSLFWLQSSLSKTTAFKLVLPHHYYSRSHIIRSFDTFIICNTKRISSHSIIKGRQRQQKLEIEKVRSSSTFCFLISSSSRLFSTKRQTPLTSKNNILATEASIEISSVINDEESTVLNQQLLMTSSSKDTMTKNTNETNEETFYNNNNHVNNIENKAKIVTDIQHCGIRIREEGKLVAFPTETVYGLGANAFNIDAILSIFAAKERPLTDPLIVHVLHSHDAYPLWNATANNDINTEQQQDHDNNDIITEERILKLLCNTFWPGPLSIVAKSTTTSCMIPNIVMANTGYVACRSPSNTIARQLLKEAAVPIVAPSANKFGHVSPTSSQHVYNDLYNEDVWIINNNNNNIPSDNNECCEVGVESTVAKVEELDGIIYITILRQGAISEYDITSCLESAGLMVKQDISTASDNSHIIIRSNLKQATKDTVANIAPGQLIKHYSPNVPSFLVSDQCIKDYNDQLQEQDNNSNMIKELLQYAIIIDYGQRLISMKDIVLQYRDLSYNENSTIGANILFDTLRWAENIPNAKIIFFPTIQQHEDNNDIPPPFDALTLAIQDKLTRAASGVTINSFTEAYDKIKS